jgi:hypothetical protein
MSAAALIFGILLASCATFEVVNGVPQNMGVISKSTLNGKTEVASYWQIGPLLWAMNGIINVGYDDFASKVKGKSCDIQVKQYWFGLVGKVTAFSK